MVTVYFFEKFDFVTSQPKRSERPATREAIKKAGSAPIESTATEVEEGQLDENGFLKGNQP